MVAVRKDYAAPTELEILLISISTKMPRRRRWSFPFAWFAWFAVQKINREIRQIREPQLGGGGEGGFEDGLQEVGGVGAARGQLLRQQTAAPQQRFHSRHDRRSFRPLGAGGVFAPPLTTA